MRRASLAGLFFLLVCLMAAQPRLAAQQAMTNDAVLKLVKAGLSDDLIITTIKASPGNYDTSANGLVALKKGGASEKVIAAIVTRASGGAPAASPASAPASGGTYIGGLPGAAPDAAVSTAPTSVPPEVDSVGVYYQDQTTGSWQEVGAEVVNFKTGGVLKHFASMGIIKGDMNGMIGGTRSKLGLHTPANRIFYVPEGRAPGEYQLLRLRLNNASREFRASTGGVAHESGGAVRDTIDYSVKKIAPRVYSITLGNDLTSGEYGFLPPLDSANNMAQLRQNLYVRAGPVTSSVSSACGPPGSQFDMLERAPFVT
jgi:hypothetical protein